MKSDLKNILSDSNKDIDNQQLMDYVSNHLENKTDIHKIEHKMIDDDFINDAVEGLQQLKQPNNISTFVEQLNTDLLKLIAKRKKKKEKHTIKDFQFIYVAFILLLLLMICCFALFKYFYIGH